MARGGRRAGTPGKAYSNRTDLQGPQAPTGLPYGDRAKLIAAQKAVPAGPAPAPMPAAPAGPPPSQPGAAGPAPGSLPFTHPTQRPGEPVTAGLPLGPGPGPEALTMNQGNPQDPIYQAVAALDALGSSADKETSALRDAMHSALGNRTVP
jgi:hypothetical protein